MNILITIRTMMYNRGSEAVLRGIVKICRFWKPNSYITVSTGEEGEILKEVLDADRVIPRYDAEGGISYLLTAAKSADVILITGADNYDWPGGNPIMEEINKKLFCVLKGKIILYDCSLKKSNFIENTKQEMMRFSYVTARETITYNLLKRELPENKVKMYPDPAFIMPIEKCGLPMGFEQGKMVGINISNLILTGRFGADEEKILVSYQNLINYILSQTDYKIILIQHIVNNGYDLEALGKLYHLYEKEKRVLLMKTELLNAMQIKYLISKLRFLVTARTHASIAAYSTCVPTLVVSYSIKSVGIAKDLFEDYERYVLPLDQMEDGTELQKKFEFIIHHEDEIREHLEKIIPSFKMRALKFGEIL